MQNIRRKIYQLCERAQNQASHTLTDDQQLFNWLENDDKYHKSKLDKISATAKIGSKRLIASMHSEETENSSHVVINVVADRHIYGAARNGWKGLNYCIDTVRYGSRP